MMELASGGGKANELRGPVIFGVSQPLRDDGGMGVEAPERSKARLSAVRSNVLGGLRALPRRLIASSSSLSRYFFMQSGINWMKAARSCKFKRE